jgi:hypothetical protein
MSQGRDLAPCNQPNCDDLAFLSRRFKQLSFAAIIFE